MDVRVDMLNGQNNQNHQGNGEGIQGKDSQGNPAQSPELNPQDQKQADKNAECQRTDAIEL